MNLKMVDPQSRQVVDEDAGVEQLGTGFAFTEGPVWHPYERHLVFSDMPGNRMRRWNAEEGVTTYRSPSNMANGNCYDARGRMVTCEHATSRVIRTEIDGSTTILASHWQGKELNSPNDVVVASDGSIYFTDPTFGRAEYYGVPREPELDFQGVYRILPEVGGGHEVQLVADDFDQPNGLCFTPDGKGLFVNDTERAHIRLFDVDGDGRLSNDRIWAEVTGDGDGAPDGMKLDSAGNLYTTGPGGVHVFDPGATFIGLIPSPEFVANFTWGDDDLCSLFLTASTSLYRIRVKVPGTRSF